MTAVQEIQAAIDKLTALKAISTPGVWAVYESCNRVSIHSDADSYSPLIDAGDFSASSESFENPLDAELIVTLHRTIDAQLAILRDFMERYEGRGKADWTPVASGAINALNLARAINGPTQ